MVVLIDANVILDYITSREPYYRESYEIIDLCYSGKVKGYIAFHSVSIIWYTLRRYIPDKSERRKWMKNILSIIEVTGIGHNDVLRALDMEGFDDFEDCLQDRCAENVNANHIITNNVKDYEESVVQAITPKDYLKEIIGNTSG